MLFLAISQWPFVWQLPEMLILICSTYKPEPSYTPGYYEEGIIWMSMGFYFDGPNKNDICDSFYDGYDVEYWRCRWGLTSAIDG